MPKANNAEENTKRITIKLTGSLIGAKEKQLRTAESLGLRKIGDTSVQPDNAGTRGKVAVIGHLIQVVEN